MNYQYACHEEKKYDAVCTQKQKIYAIHVPEIQFSVSE